MLQWLWPDPDTGWHGDRGLAYADGVFETLRILPSGPVLPDQHRDRLLAGCQALGLPFVPENWQQWLGETERRGWLTTDDKTGHIIKVIITRGSGGRGYRPPESTQPRVISSRAPMPLIPEQPVQVHLCRTPLIPTPACGGLKTLNRLDQVLAARELPPECFEGLMTDSCGRPIEGTRSNFFVIADDVLYTPPRWQLAVAGVLRNILVERLPEIGIEVRERPLTFNLVQRSQGAFIANSIFGVLPVARIGCCKLGYAERVADIKSFTRRLFGI